MNINTCFIPTVLIALLLFCLSWYLGIHKQKSIFTRILLYFSIPLSMPALLFVVYYLHWFDDAVWFYQFRSYPCSELSAAGAGLLVGFLAASMKQTKMISSPFLICLLFLGLFIPHSKSILFPVDYSSLENHWQDDVCIQTSDFK